MQPGTAALLGLGAVGAGAAYYFMVVKPRQQQLQLATTPPPASTAISTKTPAPASAGLLGDHVDRKNALAPQIVSRVTGGLIPVSAASKVTSVAGKLDVSGYAQRYISTKVPIVGKVAEAPITIAKSVVGRIASLF